MRWQALLLTVTVAICASLLARPAYSAAAKEVTKVSEANQVFKEMMAIPENAIPPTLLSNAHAIAIIPGLFKASFIFGGRYGEGVVLVRNSDGSWSNPAFITMAGGSIGWQLGMQSTDVILVFKGQRSLDGLLNHKITLGLDAAIAAGPVGRRAEADTDVQLEAEIYSYSRSRGLFAGVSLSGAVVQINYDANTAFYDQPALLPARIFNDPNLKAPPVATELRQTLAKYTPQHRQAQNQESSKNNLGLQSASP